MEWNSFVDVVDHSMKNRLLICFIFSSGEFDKCTRQAFLTKLLFVLCHTLPTTWASIIHLATEIYTERERKWESKEQVNGVVANISSINLRHARNTNTKGPLTGDTWALLCNYMAHFPMPCICKVTGTLHLSCLRPYYNTIKAEINAFPHHGLRGATACLIKDWGRRSQ